MLIKTRGIVLRAIKYGETSIIADILTEEMGLRSYIIHGVRKKNSRIHASLLHVMSLLEMVVYERDGKGLQKVKELKPVYIFRGIPFEIKKGAVGLFMAELAQKSVKESEENRSLFEFLFDSFTYLDQTEQSVANLPLKFMLDLAGFLGFQPGGEYSESTSFFDLQEGIFVAEKPGIHFLNKESSQLLFQLLQAPVEHAQQIQAEKSNRQYLLDKMIDFYRLHVENFQGLNTPEIYGQIW